MAKRRRFEIPGVGSATPAADAATMTLLVKAVPMFDLEERAASGTDMDAIHDMRVASRRLREAMDLFAPVMKKGPRAAQSDIVCRVTRSLGGVRDADVFIDALGQLAEATDDEAERLAIVYLVARRQGERRVQLKRMRRRLSNLDLAASRRKFVRAAKATRESDEAMVPLVVLGRGVLEERLDDVYGHLPGALESDGIEEQHSMRIACKQLRYAVETLAPCFDSSFSRIHRTLVSFQDILGDMHDIDMWTEYITETQRAGEHKLAGVPDEAIEAVLHDLARRRSVLFLRFKRQVTHYPEQVMIERVIGALVGVPAEPPLGISAGIPAEAPVTSLMDQRRRTSEPSDQPDAASESSREVAGEVDPLPPYVIPDAEEVS